MKTIAERLNFSDKKENENAVRIHKYKDINYYETFCLYCADNDIDLAPVSNNEYESAVSLLELHGQNDMSIEYFYFWIDND